MFEIDNEEFTDDENSYNLEPEIVELEHYSDRELYHLKDYSKHSDETLYDLMYNKKKKKPKKYRYEKYLGNDDLYDKDEIDLKIVSVLKYYKRNYDYKETCVKNVYCNTKGEFYKVKNKCKVRVSYLKNTLGYPTISIFGKIYNARDLMWETFVCLAKNLRLFYRKGNKNEIQNINWKFK